MKLFMPILLSSALIATGNTPIGEPDLLKWSKEHVYMTVKTNLEAHDGKRILVRYFENDVIHKTNADVIARNTAQELRLKTKNKSISGDLLPISTSELSAPIQDVEAALIILITSQRFSDKVEMAHVQKMNPVHVILNFDERVEGATVSNIPLSSLQISTRGARDPEEADFFKKKRGKPNSTPEGKELMASMKALWEKKTQDES